MCKLMYNQMSPYLIHLLQTSCTSFYIGALFVWNVVMCIGWPLSSRHVCTFCLTLRIIFYRGWYVCECTSPGLCDHCEERTLVLCKYYDQKTLWHTWPLQYENALSYVTTEIRGHAILCGHWNERTCLCDHCSVICNHWHESTPCLMRRL